MRLYTPEKARSVSRKGIQTDGAHLHNDFCLLGHGIVGLPCSDLGCQALMSARAANVPIQVPPNKPRVGSAVLTSPVRERESRC